MIVNLSNYFKEDSSLDELSVAEIEKMVEKYPFASVYKLLLAKKMNFESSHSIGLQSSDTTMIFYQLSAQSAVPSLFESYQTNDTSQAYQVLEKESAYIYYESNKEEMSETGIGSEYKTEPNIETGHIEYLQEDIGTKNLIIVETNEMAKPMKPLKKKKKKQKKYKLDEFSGISDFSKWLLAFKRDDVETKIKKEKKAAKKQQLKEKALKSITKSNEIISEPLAEILASQGHLDDAKKMYEQLLLKYPEKSSYFAAKINNLIKL